MELTIELAPEAEQDLHFYYLFYESKMIGLGERFLSAFEHHIHIISRYPGMRIRYDNIRCVPMNGFPFLLHYSIIENRRVVRLHAVIHTSLNPSDHWNDPNWIVKENNAIYLNNNLFVEYVYVS
jgi:toxin ParE1/3/4